MVIQADEICKVRLVAGEKISEGQVRIRRWDDKQRLVNAIKALALWWGAALVTVLIPILHFVLVPSCLLLGPIVAAFKYRQRSLVLGGEANCPLCSAPFAISGNKDQWPLDDICEGCRRHVRIEKV